MKENDTKKPETPPVTAEDVRYVYGCLIVAAVSLLLLSVGGIAAEITVIAVNIHLNPPFIPLCFAVVLPYPPDRRRSCDIYRIFVAGAGTRSISASTTNCWRKRMPNLPPAGKNRLRTKSARTGKKADPRSKKLS